MSNLSSYLQYLEDHYSNMKFQENPNWYVGQLEYKSHINVIHNGNKVYGPSKDYFNPYLLSVYIQEVWIGENSPDSRIDIVKVVDVLLQTDEKGLIHHLENKERVKPGESIYLARKLINLKDAASQLFQNEPRKKLTVDFIKSIHTQIGKNIFRDCGGFRSIEVRPKGSVFQYLFSKNIASHLNNLITFTQSKLEELEMEKGEDKIEKLIFLGSLFFSEFLLIHPFSKGNGRVARLLLNYILCGTIIVPFSLYFKNREAYIDAIESRNNRIVAPPNVLATYVLLCISQTSSNIIYLNLDKDK